MKEVTETGRMSEDSA